jgi:hypothetical protein
MQPETKFKIKFMKELEEIPNSHFEKIQQRTIRGTPDLLGIVNGVCCALELKVGDNRTDALQVYKLKAWTDCGAYTAVVDPTNSHLVIAELIAMSNRRRLQPFPKESQVDKDV